MPEGTVADLVLKALEIHPELALADRQVVIQDHQVRQAFCNFLPTISLFSTGSWTGNELAAHAENWVSGFRGAWTLFDGLANVARYKAAKVERQQTRLERENTFLSVMVGVVAAEAAARDAAEGARVRRFAYDVAAAKWSDYDAKAREGLIPLRRARRARRHGPRAGCRGPEPLPGTHRRRQSRTGHGPDPRPRKRFRNESREVT